MKKIIFLVFIITIAVWVAEPIQFKSLTPGVHGSIQEISDSLYC
jgi:hypothetical protein